MRNYMVLCSFPGGRRKVRLLLGNPAVGCHPAQYQAAWWRERRGGELSPKVLQALQELQEMARLSGTPLTELYAAVFRNADD